MKSPEETFMPLPWQRDFETVANGRCIEQTAKGSRATASQYLVIEECVSVERASLSFSSVS